MENFLVLPFCKLAWPVSAKSLTHGEPGSKLLCNAVAFTWEGKLGQRQLATNTKAEPAPSGIGFAGYASRASGRPLERISRPQIPLTRLSFKYHIFFHRLNQLPESRILRTVLGQLSL